MFCKSRFEVPHQVLVIALLACLQYLVPESPPVLHIALQDVALPGAGQVPDVFQYAAEQRALVIATQAAFKVK
jgi:hypothetical protein